MQIEFAQSEYMRPDEAARYLKISRSKLAKMRMENSPVSGPTFSRLSGCILYRREDLDRWVLAHQSNMEDG